MNPYPSQKPPPNEPNSTVENNGITKPSTFPTDNDHDYANKQQSIQKHLHAYDSESLESEQEDEVPDPDFTGAMTDANDFVAYNSLSRENSHSTQHQPHRSQPIDQDEKHEKNENTPPHTIFSEHEVLYIACLASCCGFFSTISVPIYLSALDTLASDFNVTIELINLTVTVYSIVQGLSPAIWGSVADSIGRRPVIISCLIVYIGANIGLAFAKNYGFLIGFRLLQAGGIASTITVGSGVIGDITERKNRGLYMGIFSGISMVGNAIGPLIGGALAGTLGWRSIFWFLIIASGITVSTVAVMLPETSRKRVGNGSIWPSSILNKSPYMSIRNSLLSKSKKRQKNQKPDMETLMPPSPVRITRTLELFLEKDTFIILLPNAIHYTSWFMLITAQSTLLTNQYHFTTVRLGLSYLSNGGGSIIGSFVSGRVMNYFYQREVVQFQQTHGIERATALIESRDPSFNIHRARLAPLPIVSTLQIIGSLVFGWTIEKNVHCAVPIVFTALVSFSSLFCYNLSSTLIVDLYPKEASSASAAVNLLRCLLCAAGVSAVDRMDRVLGTGVTFTLMSGLMLLTWGLNLFEIKQGPKFQKQRLDRMKEKERHERDKQNVLNSEPKSKDKDEC